MFYNGQFDVSELANLFLNGFAIKHLTILYNSSHHNAQVSAMVLAAGHRIMFRAPYYPVDGPIEFVFNTHLKHQKYAPRLVNVTYQPITRNHKDILW